MVPGKTERLVIGSVDRWTISEARDIANAATAQVRTFGKAFDEVWLQGYLVEAGKVAAPAAAEIASGFPKFAEGRQRIPRRYQELRFGGVAR